MTKQVRVDLTSEKIQTAYKKVIRRRARVAHEKTKYWDARYKAFIKSGFTEDEAYWGCKNGLSLGSKQVQKLMAHRKNQVKWRMKEFGMSWEMAVEESAQDLENKLQNKGEELNLFKEISP
jgi:hypothetical protein